MADPAPRAASSARWSSSTLRALATSSGGIRNDGAGAEPAGARATVRTPPPPPRAAAEAAAAASVRPRSVRSAVWANPVVSPTTTRMPAPRSRPEPSSSTRPSSSDADVLRRSSTNTSANSPPVRRAPPSTRSSTSLWITAAPRLAGGKGEDLLYRRAPGDRPRRARHPVGRRERHGHCHAFRRRSGPRHPPAGRPLRTGGLPGRGRAARGGADHGGYAGAVRPPGSHGGRGIGDGGGDARAGRGTPAHLHRVGQRPWRPRGGGQGDPGGGGGGALSEARPPLTLRPGWTTGGRPPPGR